MNWWLRYTGTRDLLDDAGVQREVADEGYAAVGSFAKERKRERESRSSVGVVTRDVTVPLFYFAVASRGQSRTRQKEEASER